MTELTGNITASSQQGIITTARKRAAKYFGLEDPRCAQITLSNIEDQTNQIDAGSWADRDVTIDGEPCFTADYTATIRHNYSPAHGVGTCLNCGTSGRNHA